MNIFYHLANGLVMPPAFFFAYNFYKFKGKEVNFIGLRISQSLFLLTFIITSLQFIFPEIIKALSRNGDAILSGELWRLVTPLFIQPFGIWQCVINAVFFIAFVPVAEFLYGGMVAVIYFGTGILGQIIILYWATTPGGIITGSGGSSTALFGIIGALFMYILINKENFPKRYVLIPIAGFLGATILCFFEDGHAPALLMGGLLGLLLRRKSKQITPY